MYARITDADCMCEPCMLKLPYLELRMMLCDYMISYLIGQFQITEDRLFAIHCT